MRYNGSLDTNDGWTAFGWAYDSERPDEPVDVEFLVGGRHIGTLTADSFRPDLQRHGIGDGRHAFAFRFPLDVDGADGLVARVKDTNFVLNGCPMRQAPRKPIELVAGDIVNQCNLRCPFCIVDYSNVGKLKLMTRETFDRALELLPMMIYPGNFWLSCLHEPTLHPQFIDFIEAVPDAYRDRVSFTTNLSKRLSADLLERLANSGVHEIRISFDSRQPDVFAELRKKARYAVFEENLRRLSAALRASRRRPLLRFITMAFRDNRGEIADLVRVGRELGGDRHEIRYVYYVPHLARWGKEHNLDRAEWAELEKQIEPLLSDSVTVTGPNETTWEDFEEERGTADYVAPENPYGGNEDPKALPVPDPAAIGATLPDEALCLALRWDGLIVPERPKNAFRVPINKLEQPDRYFSALRLAASRGAVR